MEPTLDEALGSYLNSASAVGACWETSGAQALCRSDEGSSQLNLQSTEALNALKQLLAKPLNSEYARRNTNETSNRSSVDWFLYCWRES